MKNTQKTNTNTNKTTKKSSFGSHFATIQATFIPHQPAFQLQKLDPMSLKTLKTTHFTQKSPILSLVFTEYSLSHQSKPSINQTWHSTYQLANIPQEAKS